MTTVNPEYNRLSASYLFSEIAKRTRIFQEQNPRVEIFRLGIGNTTEPLTPTVIAGLSAGVHKLAKVETYTGYGDELGESRLRTAIVEFYHGRGIHLDPQEVFISDGAKPDSANILSIFGRDNIVAVSDPVYPVYRDSAIIAGMPLRYLPCTEENGFIPEVPQDKSDLIYICSPNNPTGAVAKKDQLQAFIDYARRNHSVILFDAAYSAFISDPDLPRSIYEMDGARQCTIEIQSFSKLAGFTGVRLGWTIIPEDLIVEGVEPGKVRALWARRQTTMFNGASNIAQEGGLAVLSPQGLVECQGLVDHYMGNARIIRDGLVKLGLTVFGGDNAPYLWVKIPGGLSSWDFFDKVLEEAHVVGTPGSGFGSQGEGYFRFSAFGHRDSVIETVESLQQYLKV